MSRSLRCKWWRTIGGGRHWTAIAGLAVAVLMAAEGGALGQNYPSQQIRIIVPYAAGGLADAATRIVAAKMQENVGQPVLVENRPGAGAVIGHEMVAKAPPDGYTLLITSTSYTVMTSLYEKLPFDPINDFMPIAMVAFAPSVLVTGPNAPFKTVQEAVAYGKANPDKMSFASAGNGTLGHLMGERLKREAGFDMIHIPHRGGGPALIEVMAGRIPLFFDTLTTTSTNAKAGKIRPLAVAAEKRHALLPDTPTLIEAGFPGFTGTSWIGMLAAAKTPKDIAARVNSEVSKAVSAADVKERLAGLGTDAGGGSAEEFAAFLGNERARWASVIRDAGIKIE